ncbi:MAG: chemotaxis protein CheA [Dehalococcoidales bacterium]|nr:chemotaxis protein CheA [Dehalococcoidales bacterium]
MDLAAGITPEDLNLFIQEADEQLQLLDEDIVRLEKEFDNPDLMQEIFRAAHTLKGSSAMVGHQRLSDLAHAMENVLDQVRKGVLSVSPLIIDALLHGLDIMRMLRKELDSPDAEPADITDAVAELSALLTAVNQPAKRITEQTGILTPDAEAQAELEKACQEGKQAYFIKVSFDEQSNWTAVRSFQVINSLSAIGEIIVSLPTTQEIEEGAINHLFQILVASNNSEEDIKELLTGIPEVESVEINAYEKDAPEEAPKAAGPDSAATAKEDIKLSHTVRVDVNRLDTLMEQVGELVINRNQISQLGRTLAEKYHEDEIIVAFGDSVSQIAKIISTLQQDVMSIRLLPVEIVFNTLPRMVRDIARKENKKVEFIIEGQETEVDRSVIEQLRDPLIHMLRNSIDHGIEAPEERISAGKPEAGTIRLTAMHEQDNIVITVKDDGKGIEPKAIRKSAVDKKIYTSENISKLTDSEAVNLIFDSGLSTASEVTNVSGRGVGLDVVKTNIESLGGSVSVESVPGQGTTFTLTLPLTLAIIPALLVSTGGTICAIPLSSIVEADKLDEKEIQTVRGKEVTLFRGDVLPLLRLDEVFGWSDENNRNNEALHIVVVKYAGTRVGLVVEELLEQQELVVKSLDHFIGASKGITGASILGDGRVVLILDITSLIRGTIIERQNGDNIKTRILTSRAGTK